nr:WGxxGxxG family protein [Dendronalium sp. ChiSLP03b]MDZ8205733.1 WGxxGxxG family protein [Dendronalium sp. ChiSLP03b]
MDTDTTGTGTTGTDATTSDPSYRGTSEVRSDRSFDWGWLGLLGLLGLAGLARKREEPKAYRDPNEVTSSRSRY